jgi:TPR repeat protein
MKHVTTFIAILMVSSQSLAEPIEKAIPPCDQDSIEKYQQGVEENDAHSSYMMARHYSTGKCLAGDGEKAVQLYFKAMEQSYPPAFYNVGMMMAANQQFELAAKTFFAGAAKGHRGAELQLGILFSLVPPPVGNDASAYAWLSLTAGRNEPVAEEARGILAKVKSRVSTSELEEGTQLLGKLEEDFGAIPPFEYEEANK